MKTNKNWKLSNNAKAVRRYRKNHPDRVIKTRHRHYLKKKREDPTYWAKKLKQRRKRNPEKTKKHAQKARLKIRKEVILHYGGKCKCCGEKELDFLTLDHPKGGGTKHRKRIKAYGQKFYWWLKRNGFPKGYHVLCANCNMAKSRIGGCPHQKKI